MSDLHLYVYDLTKGMAKQFSVMFLGKHFDGVWHTGIVAFGDEWYFGNDGISHCAPKQTILGEPNEILNLGRTNLTEGEFLQQITVFAESTFKVGSYNLLEHNCNNFSHELAIQLLGKGIPQHILDLPKEVLNTPLGPMLRPMLEQAADPMHMSNGQAQNFSSKLAAAAGANAGIGAKATATTEGEDVSDDKVPHSVLLFPYEECEKEMTALLAHLDDSKLLKTNDYQLLAEIKEYLQQPDGKINWSIGANHVKTLVNLYLTVLNSNVNDNNSGTDKNEIQQGNDRLAALRVVQSVSLRRDVAKVVANNERMFTEFVDLIKSETCPPDIKFHSFQTLSNVCSHRSVSQSVLKKHQDRLFKELSEFTLIEADSDMKTLLHESAISLFYNLVSAYHSEELLTDANALMLGCALLERMPKLKSKPKTVYQMLHLLRSCLSKSQSMRELALSMDFDLSKYATPEEKAVEKEEGESGDLVSNIDKLIHPKNDSDEKTSSSS